MSLFWSDEIHYFHCTAILTVASTIIATKKLLIFDGFIVLSYAWPLLKPVESAQFILFSKELIIFNFLYNSIIYMVTIIFHLVGTLVL